MARSMLSLGIEASLAFWMASCSAGLPSGSPPPSLAATVIARASLVNSLPRRASTIAFLCLMPAHLECPAITALRLPGDLAVQRDVGLDAAVGAERLGARSAVPGGRGIGAQVERLEQRAGERFRLVAGEQPPDALVAAEDLG